ncbi:hypothetical protein [Consotaella salsifontis]|uniref:Uncharacterized protein n=1 Tax=Consotaella salsifontis TaxID=1365950 RepID=A0A1T4Q014_9HYPH|nr:hypothetical protein [Consotaella salsifontis]SJZ97105.1 hypothetical protein SAMN05428963_104274 [Consotaella salsifontis]
MIDFFDWLTAGDGGRAVHHLARRYLISQQEMRNIAEAVAPAFALTLRRVENRCGGRAVFAHDMLSLLPRDGVASIDICRPSARRFMASFFGSGALAAAVARHASLLTSIAPDTIEKVMPTLAALTLERITRERATGSIGTKTEKSIFEDGQAGFHSSYLEQVCAKPASSLSEDQDMAAPEAQKSSPASIRQGNDAAARSFAGFHLFLADSSGARVAVTGFGGARRGGTWDGRVGKTQEWSAGSSGEGTREMIVLFSRFDTGANRYARRR